MNGTVREMRGWAVVTSNAYRSDIGHVVYPTRADAVREAQEALAILQAIGIEGGTVEITPAILRKTVLGTLRSGQQRVLNEIIPA